MAVRHMINIFGSAPLSNATENVQGDERNEAGAKQGMTSALAARMFSLAVKPSCLRGSKQSFPNFNHIFVGSTIQKTGFIPYCLRGGRSPRAR